MRTTAVSMDEGPARLGVEPSELASAIAAAAEEEGRPSADRCTIPGPVLALQIRVSGRLLTAQRESEDADAAWRVILD